MAVSDSIGLQRASRPPPASPGGLCPSPRRLMPFPSVGKCAELDQVRILWAVKWRLWSVVAEKWFTMSLEATGGHTSTFFGLPAAPQARGGAKEVETVSSIACLGRKRPAGDSISAAGGVLGRRQACGAWWWARRCGVCHLQKGFSGDFFLVFSSWEDWVDFGLAPSRN